MRRMNKMTKEKLKLYSIDEKQIRDLIDSRAKETYRKDICEFGLDRVYENIIFNLSNSNEDKKILWNAFKNNYLNENEAKFVLNNQLNVAPFISLDYDVNEEEIKEVNTNGREFKKILTPDRDMDEIRNVLDLGNPNRNLNSEYVDYYGIPNFKVSDFYPQMSIISFEQELFFSESGFYKAIQAYEKILHGEERTSKKEIAKMKDSLLEDKVISLIEDGVKNDLDYFQHLYTVGRMDNKGNRLD